MIGLIKFIFPYHSKKLANAFVILLEISRSFKRQHREKS